MDKNEHIWKEFSDKLHFWAGPTARVGNLEKPGFFQVGFLGFFKCNLEKNQKFGFFQDFFDVFGFFSRFFWRFRFFSRFFDVFGFFQDFFDVIGIFELFSFLDVQKIIKR